MKVEKFIFPTNFVVLDFDENCNIPIIIGRPFLATSRALIDFENGELTMRLNEDKVTYKVFSSLNTTNVYFVIDIKERNIKKETQDDHNKVHLR